jgi:hypothetical protein
MLSDPQSVTVSGSTISLPRITEVAGYADYQSADGVTSLRISQSGNNSTKRASIALRTAKIAADPISGVNSRKTSTVSVNVTKPLDGFDVAELTAQLVGLASLLTASSAAIATRIISGEK